MRRCRPAAGNGLLARTAAVALACLCGDYYVGLLVDELVEELDQAGPGGGP